MSAQYLIHPQKHDGPGSVRLCSKGLPSYSNANCVDVVFEASEHYDPYGSGGYPIRHEITVFHLSQTDADMLALCGMLDADRREKAVEMLWGLLDEQKGTAA